MLQVGIKKGTLQRNSVLPFNSEERVKPKEKNHLLASHKLIWFQDLHSQRAISPSGFPSSLQVPKPQRPERYCSHDSSVFLWKHCATHYSVIPGILYIQNGKTLQLLGVCQICSFQFILGALWTGLQCLKIILISSHHHLLKSFPEQFLFTRHEQLLSAYCVPIHQKYKTSNSTIICFFESTFLESAT